MNCVSPMSVCASSVNISFAIHINSLNDTSEFIYQYDNNVDDERGFHRDK